jgi:ferrous iron transport protein B
MKVILVGNPNTGKSTLFNRLTGSHQREGNWPGVTVDTKVGYFQYNHERVNVVDLPGIYALNTSATHHALDETIACQYILNNEPDVLVNIIDATCLERSLYLTMQLFDMGVPVIVVVNMLDLARKQRIQLNLDQLRHVLGCPVIGITARQGVGIEACKQLIVETVNTLDAMPKPVEYSQTIKQGIQDIAALMQGSPQQRHFYAIRFLEGDTLSQQVMEADALELSEATRQALSAQFEYDLDITIADERYRSIQQRLLSCVQVEQTSRKNFTDRLDAIILNRFIGIPFFLLVMYSLFLFAMNVGGVFQDCFDLTGNAIFVDGTTYVLQSLGINDWLVALLAVGVGSGMTTTITFIPVIGAMFLFLAFLEDSGYMARAAFVVDRGMRAVGLPGKSFVPLIVGFGCNVPAVMAARTLDSHRDRVLTIMMSPFMSCGARLAVYALFAAAFFPKGAHNIVFALYFIGISMAVLTGMLLRKTLLSGDPSPLVMELPAYHLPNFRSVVLQAWQRLKRFVTKAGKVIIPLCVAISVLNSMTVTGTIDLSQEGHQESWLSIIGKTITPVFAPMGIHQDNWPATVGIATGMMAKEVVVATLNTLYSQEAAVSEKPNLQTIVARLQDALHSIGDNFWDLANAWRNPIAAYTPGAGEVKDSIYGQMYARFDGKIGAFAYLLFLLLYFPCVSTTAVMVRELNWRWTLFSVTWTTGVAYAVAVVFYQVATLLQHPLGSVAWVILFFVLLAAVIQGLRRYSLLCSAGGVRC